MNRLIFILAMIGLLLPDFTQAQSYTAGKTENVGLGSITILELGNNGDIWAGSMSSGVGFYNGVTQQWTYYNTLNTSAMRSDSVTSLTFGLISGIQHAYIGTTSGLLDIRAGVVDTIQIPNSRRINGVALVGQDTLWVASDSGIVAIDSNKQVIATRTTVNSSIPFDRAVTAQKGGSPSCTGIAVGSRGKGLFFTKNYSTFTLIDTSLPNYSLVDNRVNTIYKEANCSRYIVGTKGGLSLCPEGVPCQNYTIANGLPQNDVTSVAVDCRGQIWIGMRDSGVAIFNGASFTRFTHADGLSDDHVTTIAFDGPNCEANIGSGDGNITKVDSTHHVTRVLNGVADIGSVPAVSVYPQPASSTVSFVFESAIADGEIRIIDMNGRQIQQVALRGDTHAVADVAHLADGLYFYTLSTGGAIVRTGKVQVAR